MRWSCPCALLPGCPRRKRGDTEYKAGGSPSLHLLHFSTEGRGDWKNLDEPNFRVTLDDASLWLGALEIKGV